MLGGCGKTSPYPEGCEDLFTNGEFACRQGAEICDAVLAQPDRQFNWSVQFDEDLGGSGTPSDKISDFERKAQCTRRYIENRGIELLSGEIDNEYFFAAGTPTDFEPLCRAAMINDCGPTARDEDCKGLTENGCEADPLCWSYHGTVLSEAGDCVEHDRFARCFSMDSGCNAAQSTYVNDGACWYFGSGCFNNLDDEWSEGSSCTPFDEVETLPPCG